MDEMKIVTPLLKGIIARIVRKLVKDKLSLDVNLQIHDISVKHEEQSGQFTFEVNVGGSLRANQLKEFLEANDII